MIALKLEGRLGNQLFQYAFIYAAARKLNTRFYLDKSIDRFLLDEYFNIEKETFQPFDHYLFSIKGFKNFFTFHLKRKFYTLIKRLFRLKEVIFNDNLEPATQMGQIKNNCIFQGFFQSEQYFSAYKKEVVNLYQIKNIYKKQFEEIFNTLPPAPKYVTIHVRRGDYINHNLALNISYYHNAIKTVHIEGNYYIFISDDPDFVKKEFNYLSNSYVSERDEITDLQFLINADICILSNSSFSWWGAWLNNKANKTVIVPQLWLGKTAGQAFPSGVIQPEWTLLNVE